MHDGRFRILTKIRTEDCTIFLIFPLLFIYHITIIFHWLYSNGSDDCTVPQKPLFGRCSNTLLKVYDNSETTETSQTLSIIYIEVQTQFGIWIVFHNQDKHGCCWLKSSCYPQRKNSHIFWYPWEHGTDPRNTHECQPITIVDNPSTVDTALKNIGASRSQNIFDTSYIKVCKKYGSNKTVHD